MSTTKFTHRQIMLGVIVFTINLLCGGTIIAVNCYQNSVYEHDKELYDIEKSQFIQQQDSVVQFVRDSVFLEWVASNDTTIRTIKRTVIKYHTMKIDDYKDSLDHCGWKRDLGFARDTTCHGTSEQYREAHEKLTTILNSRPTKTVKTGRLLCHESINNPLVCVPERKTIWIPNTITLKTRDTIWTAGYSNRNEWIYVANQYADSVAQASRREFRSYTGHQYHYLFATNSFPYLLSVFNLVVVVVLMVVFMILGCFSLAERIRETKSNSGFATFLEEASVVSIFTIPMAVAFLWDYLLV